MSRRKSYNGVETQTAIGVGVVGAAAAAYFFIFSEDARLRRLLNGHRDNGAILASGQTGAKYVIVKQMKQVLRADGTYLLEGVPSERAEIAFLMKKYNVDLD